MITKPNNAQNCVELNAILNKSATRNKVYTTPECGGHFTNCRCHLSDLRVYDQTSVSKD